MAGDRVAELEALVGRLLERVADLEAQVVERDTRIVELEKLLGESRRAGRRQAAPFSKGDPAAVATRLGSIRDNDHNARWTPFANLPASSSSDNQTTTTTS